MRKIISMVLAAAVCVPATINPPAVIAVKGGIYGGGTLWGQSEMAICTGGVERTADCKTTCVVVQPSPVVTFTVPSNEVLTIHRLTVEKGLVQQ